MTTPLAKKIFFVLVGLLLLWLGGRYLLPLILPFLLGGLLALVAEPLVAFAQKRLGLNRGFAAGIGVTVTLLLLVGLISALAALLLRALIHLAAELPDMEQTAKEGFSMVQTWAVDLSNRAPRGVQPMVTRTVENAFRNGNAFMDQATGQIPHMIATVLSGLPDGLLRFGTALLAAFMISVRLPRIRTVLSKRITQQQKEKYLPILQRIKASLLGWLRAEGMLALITYAIVLLGFLFLRVPYGFIWAFLIALVDAVPMLGTGLVLVPWALVEFLMHRPISALLLLATFTAATVARTALEPKFLGKQLGFDPLITLICLYVGYHLWGFFGLILAPILAAVGKTILDSVF